MKKIETDVLVVGAGPGGSMAAKFAARQGVRTLLIEKRQEIGAPVRCAEGVSEGWLAECEVTVDPAWVACRPEGARDFLAQWELRDGARPDRAGNEVGLILERHLFDKALARDAAQAGAAIMLKTYATDVLRSQGRVAGVVGKSLGEDVEIRAGVVIGADGFESQVGRWAGIRTDLQACDVEATIQYRLCNIDCDPRYLDFYIGSCAPGGYIWVFPKGRGAANVGIGVRLSLLRGKGEAKGYLDRWIATQSGLAKGQPLEIVGGGVSANKPPEQTVTDGLMLVGDAARLIDPLTGGGIVNACLSGKLAGEIAAQAVRHGDSSAKFLQRYEQAWRKRLGQKLLRNWMAKEKITELDDATFDSIVATLAEAGPSASTLSLLMAIGKKHPRLVAGFAKMLFT